MIYSIQCSEDSTLLQIQGPSYNTVSLCCADGTLTFKPGYTIQARSHLYCKIKHCCNLFKGPPGCFQLVSLTSVLFLAQASPCSLVLSYPLKQIAVAIVKVQSASLLCCVKGDHLPAARTVIHFCQTVLYIVK